MRTTKILTLGYGLVLTATGCARAAAPAVSAAPPPPDNAVHWPDHQDAVKAAPHHHRVVLENEQVRVLDVTIAPGEVEPLHTHRWPSVLYIMTAAEFIDRDEDGMVLFDSRALPAPLSLPKTTYKGPTQRHSVENLSKTVTIHLLRIELKQTLTPSALRERVAQ